MIHITRPAADALSRECWDSAVHQFSTDAVALVLTGYRVERRVEARGRYRTAGPLVRRRPTDERSYYSGLPRPRAVPADVLAEARSKLEVVYFVAHATPERELTRLGDAVFPERIGL